VQLPVFAATVYNVNLSIGTGTVTGTVTTDGNTGTLTDLDFTNWDLTIKDGATSATLLGPGFGAADNSFDQMNGSSVSATASNITFNFSGSAGANAYFFFENLTGPADFVCFGPGGGGLFGGVCASGQNGNVEAFEINGGDNQSILLTGTQTIAATPLPAALPLFATGLGVAGLLARRRKRKNGAAIAAA
jgi:hypothetical protein